MWFTYVTNLNGKIHQTRKFCSLMVEARSTQQRFYGVRVGLETPENTGLSYDECVTGVPDVCMLQVPDAEKLPSQLAALCCTNACQNLLNPL